MKQPTFCDYCGQKLDLGREFVYQLESIQEAEDPRLQGLVDEHSVTADGEPLRLCERCRESIDDNLVAMLKEEDEGGYDPELGGRAMRNIVCGAIAAIIFGGILSWLLVEVAPKLFNR